MNQEKIGKFISQLRREQGLTQEQLGTELGVTAKAVSKWENGRCLPDPSLYKPLCQILGISLTELFNGEYIEQEKAVEKTDEVLSEIVTKSAANKLFNTVSALITIFGIILLFASAVSRLDTTVSVALVSAGLLMLLLGFSIRVTRWRLDSGKVVKNTGMGFSGALTVVFIALKLMGHIEWPWIWVVSPLWISVGLVIAVIAAVLLAAAVFDFVRKKRK